MLLNTGSISDLHKVLQGHIDVGDVCWRQALVTNTYVTNINIARIMIDEKTNLIGNH